MIVPQSELHFSHLSTLCPPTMLMLDHNTLFLLELKQHLKFNSSSILKWTKSIQQNPTVHSRAGVSNQFSMSHVTPALTNWSTIASTSGHTFDVLTQHCPQSLQACIKSDPLISNEDWQHKFVQVQEENVISDRDEVEGVEYNAAMKSPLKGAGVHVRSDVCFDYHLIIV